MPNQPTQPPTGKPPQPQPLPQTATGPSNLQSLQQAVSNQVTVEKSAVALINGMADHLHQMASEAGPGGSIPADELSALAKQLNDSSAALAAAVRTNTPADHQPGGSRH